RADTDTDTAGASSTGCCASAASPLVRRVLRPPRRRPASALDRDSMSRVPTPWRAVTRPSAHACLPPPDQSRSGRTTFPIEISLRPLSSGTFAPPSFSSSEKPTSRGLSHPNRKQPSDPQEEKIEREENDEADITTKLALDNEPDEIVSKVARNHEGDVIDDQ